MGIPQFLPLGLEAAGRPLDLSVARKQQNGRRTTRLRVGVDVATWIYRACMGFSDMLGDERHLTNLGRADLQRTHPEPSEKDEAKEGHHQQQDLGQESEKPPANDSPSVSEQQYIGACTEQVLRKLKDLQGEADILVVFDGATPPLKRPTSSARSDERGKFLRIRDHPQVDPSGQDQAQRLKSFARAGAGKLFSTIVANLQHACRNSCIPFLVAPYEADAQLGFLSIKGWIDLVLTEDSDLMACASTHVLYKCTDQRHGVLLRRDDLFATALFQDFSDAMLAIVFVSCGGDYCDKLQGIGLKTAAQIVRRAYFEESDDVTPPLASVLKQLFQATYDKGLTEDVKSEYESKFLSALLMYRHPVVFDPVLAQTVVVRIGQLDRELASYQPYVDLYEQSLHNVVGDLLPRPLSIYVAEGWICPRTQRKYPCIGNVPLPESVQQYLASVAPPAASTVGTVPDNETASRVTRTRASDPTTSQEAKNPETLAAGAQQNPEIIEILSSSDASVDSSAFETQPVRL